MNQIIVNPDFNTARPRKLKRNKVSVSLLLLFSVTACTSLGPDYTEPVTAEEGGPVEKFDEQPSSDVQPSDSEYATENEIFTNDAVNVTWWRSAFDDSEINVLVDKAINQNLSLRSAGLRVLQSQQQLAIATANQYPQQQAISGGVSREKSQGTVFNNFNTGFNLSWEVDFWGRFQRQIESAEAQVEANVADYDSVMISLVSQVVENYILIRTYQNRIEVAELSLDLQQENYLIALAKHNSGETSELDVEQARSLLNNTKANVPNLQISLQQFKNNLSLLLSESPQHYNYLLKEDVGIPSSAAVTALGMPQDLIRRRPDIRTAERQLAAQSAQIGFAITELYPHFSVGGAIGTSASEADNLFNSNSQNWSLFSLFNWNIFNYGRLQSNVRLQDALFQQLLVDYRHLILQAQVDVENAIVAYLKSHEQVAFYQTAADSAKHAVDLATFQYQNGLVNFNTVINTLNTYTEQQDLLVSTQGVLATNLVQVYLSLGGGWEVRQGEDPVELLPSSIKQEMQERTDYWEDIL